MVSCKFSAFNNVSIPEGHSVKRRYAEGSDRWSTHNDKKTMGGSVWIIKKKGVITGREKERVTADRSGG